MEASSSRTSTHGDACDTSAMQTHDPKAAMPAHGPVRKAPGRLTGAAALHAPPAPQDIKLFINSPGGSVTAGMGIYDAMMMCRADVQTYCFGLAASMGAFLLGAGAKVGPRVLLLLPLPLLRDAVVCHPMVAGTWRLLGMLSSDAAAAHTTQESSISCRDPASLSMASCVPCRASATRCPTRAS